MPEPADLSIVRGNRYHRQADSIRRSLPALNIGSAYKGTNIPPARVTAILALRTNAGDVGHYSLPFVNTVYPVLQAPEKRGYKGESPLSLMQYLQKPPPF